MAPSCAPSDQGQTWARTNVPIKFGGNEAGRGNGERMAVDPNDGRVLFLGTRKNGLWKSADGAVTWAKVTTFPGRRAAALPRGGQAAGLERRRPEQHRVRRLRSDERQPRANASRTVFAGVSVMGKPGLFRSDDAGVSWKVVPGQPTKYRPNHAVLASDGNLFVSYGTDPGPMPMVDGAVWKLDTRSGAWTDVTPDRPDARAQVRIRRRRGRRARPARS